MLNFFMKYSRKKNRIICYNTELYECTVSYDYNFVFHNRALSENLFQIRNDLA